MKRDSSGRPDNQENGESQADSGAMRPSVNQNGNAPESIPPTHNQYAGDSGAIEQPVNQMSRAPESIPPSHNQHSNDSGAMVLFYADMVDDCERSRIAQQNRLRSMRQVKGIEEVTPEYIAMGGLVETFEHAEKTAIKYLERHMKKHPLGPFVKKTIGLGMKQTARLLALIGDPAWHRIHNRDRTLGELWAYCGLHVVGHKQFESHIPDADNAGGGGPSIPRTDNHEAAEGHAPKRSKGVKSKWSSQAKTRAHLIATSCMKQRTSPFRKVYDDRRAHTKETHPDWTDGHSHNDALRITSKAILKALWLESKGQGGFGNRKQNAP